MARVTPITGLVPITGPSGDILWQEWTWGELVSHLSNELTLDVSSIDNPGLGNFNPAHLFTVNVASSGTPVAAGGGEVAVTLTHNLNSVAARVLQLGFRDGAWMAHTTWRYSITDANNIALTFGNNHPTNAAWGFFDCAVINY